MVAGAGNNIIICLAVTSLRLTSKPHGRTKARERSAGINERRGGFAVLYVIRSGEGETQPHRDKRR